jgi:hypothetical protein
MKSQNKVITYKQAWYLKNKTKILARRKKHYQQNKTKVDARNRAWSRKNPDKAKEIARRANKKRTMKIVGINQLIIDQQLISQNNSCAICGISQKALNYSLAIDHCHTTGKFRGLLCHPCNLGIGNFKDIPGLLLEAYNYLIRRN